MRGILVLLIALLMQSPLCRNSQTKVAKEQIEDAFLLKTGGSVFGDVTAATSSLKAATFELEIDTGFFQIVKEGSKAILRSNLDLYLDPTANGTAGAKIVPATVMEFPDFLGDKIRFFSHSYSIGISPYDLDITSDRNIKFHSDTMPDLMVILGDQGDVQTRRDLQSGRNLVAGGIIQFVTDSEGDKLRLYGTLYRVAISNHSFDFYSDNLFTWHTDTHSSAMQLQGDTGRLLLSGPLGFPVYTTLPSGNVGDVIYFDDSEDDRMDGLYLYLPSEWRKVALE